MNRTVTEIQTFTGKCFDFLDPDPDSIDIRDIAHALSLVNRFGGHTPKPYSVAQHCVLASFAAPYELAFEALMHDAQEAYVGDIPTTLKQLMPQYQVIEDRAEAAIRAKFGLPEEFSPIVKMIDRRLLVTEAREFGMNWWPIMGVEPYPHMDVTPWHWEEARDQFMRRFNNLMVDR